MDFKIGRNPLQSDDRPWKYVPVRHVPIDPESFAYYGEDLLPNFDALPTWKYATPHNIQRNTPQTETCDACHGNADLFLDRRRCAARGTGSQQGCHRRRAATSLGGWKLDAFSQRDRDYASKTNGFRPGPAGGPDAPLWPPARSWPRSLPTRAVWPVMANRACRPTLPSGEVLYLTVDPQVYNASVHGQEGMLCIHCHAETSDYPHPALTAGTRREFSLSLYRSSCVLCHQDKYDTTLDGVHQVALAGGDTRAAICTDCHGTHNIAAARGAT